MHVRASTILSLAATYDHEDLGRNVEVLLYVSSQDESRNFVRRGGTMGICPRPPMGRTQVVVPFLFLPRLLPIFPVFFLCPHVIHHACAFLTRTYQTAHDNTRRDPAPPTGGARRQEDRAAELLRCGAHAPGGDDAGLPPERRGVLRDLRGAQEHGPDLLESYAGEVHQVPSGAAHAVPRRGMHAHDKILMFCVRVSVQRLWGVGGRGCLVLTQTVHVYSICERSEVEPT